MSLNDNLDENAEVTLFRHATLSGLQMAAGTSVFVFKSHSWTDPPASTLANKAVCTWVETGVKLKRKVFNRQLHDSHHSTGNQYRDALKQKVDLIC